MLDEAGKTDMYTALHEALLGKPEEFKENFLQYNNNQDFVVASGLLAHGHCTSEVMDEMLHACKVGGIIVLSCRVSYLESLKY